jgi:hypothetical protein
MRYLIYILIAGNLFALGVGVLLLVAPQKLVGWVGIGARWMSFRRATRTLDMNHNTDHALMQQPRLLGAILVVSGAIILVRGALFASHIGAVDGGRMLQTFFGANPNPGAWETLWLSLLIAVMLGAVLALAVGLLALFNTDLLQRVSDIANRWVSPRQAMRPLARTYRGLDRMINDAPRFWGALITVLAIYAAGMLLWFAKLGG